MFSFLALFFIFYLNKSSGEIYMKHATIIFRHGDRTPIAFYPTDPYRNQSDWPVPFGQLTNTGKMQHFLLGQWLRDRYMKFLPQTYDPEEIYVKSTDVDRTLMSAQANLAGLFPPSGSSVWNKALMWQPIPVHTVPTKDDEILAMEKQCDAYQEEKNEYLKSDEHKKELSKYQDLMNYLSSYTGMKIRSFNDINQVYNNLYIESLYNKTLPPWTNQVFPDMLRAPAGYSFRINTMTPSMARLYVGPLLKEIITKMADVVTNKSKLKLSIYSGHDLTVGSLLNALNLFDGVCPPYTATIIMELLYDDVQMVHTVKLLYRNTTEIVEPDALKIPHCGTLCPFERFKHLYSKLMPNNWESECKKEQWFDLFTKWRIDVICVVVVTFVAYKTMMFWVDRASRHGPANYVLTYSVTSKP